MRKSLIIVLIIIFLLTLIASGIGLAINNYKEKSYLNSLTEEELEEKENEDALLEKLQNMSEEERIKFYFGEYLGYIENGNYEKAYDALNENFKNAYFKDLNSFKEYISKNYPTDISVSYSEIQRYGEVYLLTVIISSIYEDFEAFEQNVVIHEFGADNYKLSFEVKEGMQSEF